jgi:hypothetical protein
VMSVHEPFHRYFHPQDELRGFRHGIEHFMQDIPDNLVTDLMEKMVFFGLLDGF